MDRERDRDTAEELIDEVKKEQTGARETTRRPEQGTDKPGGDEGTEPRQG
ncbi:MULTISPECIES: hypothetical protein [Methylobacterium]|uniref:Uncharacterized protein n=1 Tax=Methylobacterium jeotgali TaxID=381630 RepID=A0ABQ4SWL5_9HYPH|nr:MULTISPECIES: hypothetical protein [Methylobacterium]GBU16593.1 hypothetical protein AwMethylo_08080 [Methylobacterium sp.]GJE07601.1 hypothetical protein AOPFMNJM_2930 [Methylobacterium jeotgali]